MKKDNVIKLSSGLTILIILSFSVLCKTDNAFGKSNLKCFSCGNKISGKYIVLDKTRVHPQCFTCKECGKTISGRYNINEEGLFHPECYKIATGLVCDICDKPMSGTYRKDDDGQYHPTCYVNHKLEKCIVCSAPIEGRYLTDPWGNSSHSTHNGLDPDLCGSCGRIISTKSSKGGFMLNDGRLVCGICSKTSVTQASQVDKAAGRVRKIIASTGLLLPKKLPIRLVDQFQLSNLAGAMYTETTKGFTTSKTTMFGKKIISSSHNIYVLQSLPELEFMGVLAHEFLHAWLNEKRISLSLPQIEGFCNLGIMLVNSSSLHPLATILMKNLEKNPDPVYGEGYRKIKKRLDKVGWKNLIKKISG